MNKILLITYNNNYYKNYFHDRDFQILEFQQPLSDDIIKKIDGLNFSGSAILEINNDDIDILKNIIDILKKSSASIVALCGKKTEKTGQFLIDNGMAELFQSEDAQDLPEYINIINNKKTGELGRILILEDLISRIEIFKSIITRFGYEPVIINSIDDLFEKIEAISFQMIFFNLGTSGFDVNKFTRKSKLSNTIKKIPVIPYKDMNRGLYIHEMLTGLNKVASIILSSEDVYSFLLDILFRKELFRAVNKLNLPLEGENLQLYSQEPLSRIYSLMGTNIFSMRNIFQNEKIESLKAVSESIRETLLKVQGLKWLRLK